MIRINKTSLAPQSLASQKQYNGEDVQRLLHDDQKGKCYLCERECYTDYNIEHLRSKTNFPDLVYEWNNLFLVCSYCNSKKLDLYDDFPSPSEHQIEDIIKQEFLSFENIIEFTYTQEIENIQFETLIQFLSTIHNGKRNCRKFKEEIFFKQIRVAILSFNQLIINYQDDCSDINRQLLKDSMSADQEFLGIKYWIIKSNNSLAAEFADELQQMTYKEDKNTNNSLI